jgi:hypothetical protein
MQTSARSVRERTPNAERSPLLGSGLSNSHSGALLARIDRSTLVGGSSRGTSSGALGGDVATAAILIVLLTALVASSLGNGLGVLLVLVHGPVEYVVVLETLSDEKIAEDLAEVRIVRLIIKAQRARVVEIDSKFVRESTAENLGGGCHLLLHDTVVFLLLGGRLQALPRKGATAEVEHDVTEGLHVVASRLLCFV